MMTRMNYPLLIFLSLSVLAIWGVRAFAPVRTLVPSVGQGWKAEDDYSPATNSFVQRGKISHFARSAASTTYREATTTAYTSPQSAATIQDLLHFTNQERYRNKLGELQYHKDLEKAAQRHAADMAKNNYFSHDGLTGSDLKDRVGLTNYRYTNVGENLFWRTPDNDPAYAVQGWMESPGHRKNMLDAQFTEIGLGYAVDEANGKHYYVQVFGRPIDTPNVQGPQATIDTMFQASNEARQKQGLPSFSVSMDLNQGAQEHANDMMRTGQLTNKLKRGSYDRFFTNLGARFAAREVFNDPHGAVQGWIQKGPQSDILSERFTETGIGYATDGEQHYYVQLFGLPMETGVGRRDDTRPIMPPPRSNSGSGEAPEGPGMGAARIGNRYENYDTAPQGPAPMNPKKKKEDKARNGDFGRIGFGQTNKGRRQDVDELDDDWSDDRKVMARLQNRRGPVRVADKRRIENYMDPVENRERALRSDGFDNSWNSDYSGRAAVNREQLARDPMGRPTMGRNGFAMVGEDSRRGPSREEFARAPPQGGGGQGPYDRRQDMMGGPQGGGGQGPYDRRQDMMGGPQGGGGQGPYDRRQDMMGGPHGGGGQGPYDRRQEMMGGPQGGAGPGPAGRRQEMVGGPQGGGGQGPYDRRQEMMGGPQGGAGPGPAGRRQEMVGGPQGGGGQGPYDRRQEMMEGPQGGVGQGPAGRRQEMVGGGFNGGRQNGGGQNGGGQNGGGQNGGGQNGGGQNGGRQNSGRQNSARQNGARQNSARQNGARQNGGGQLDRSQQRTNNNNGFNTAQNNNSGGRNNAARQFNGREEMGDGFSNGRYATTSQLRSGGGQLDRPQNMGNGFVDDRNGGGGGEQFERRSTGNGSGNGRPIGQVRRMNSKGAFGTPNKQQQEEMNFGNSVNNIHFQRHEQLSQRRGMDRMRETDMGGEGFYGPPGQGMPRMGGPGGRGDPRYEQDFFNFTPQGGRRNQMSDPATRGRYDFGQPPNQSIGPRDRSYMGAPNLGMGASSEFGRGEYYVGQYSNGMNGAYDFGWDGMGIPNQRATQPGRFGGYSA